MALSVSQLFTGGASKPPAPEAQKEESKERPKSSEVPIDEEDEPESLAESLELNVNVGVKKESIRMHEGNTIRKKILFHEDGISAKVGSKRRQKQAMSSSKSNKESLFNAQSYN